MQAQALPIQLGRMWQARQAHLELLDSLQLLSLVTTRQCDGVLLNGDGIHPSGIVLHAVLKGAPVHPLQTGLNLW